MTLGLLISCPVWTVISWALGWAGQDTLSDIALAFAYVALGILMVIVAASRWEDAPHE